jgi:hypothetical protein
VHVAVHIDPLQAVLPPTPVGAVGHDTHAPGAGPQFLVPLGQGWHIPPAQLAPVGHTAPQAPQLFASVCVFTHAEPQRLGSAAVLHEATHVDPLQAVVPLPGAAGQDAQTPGAGPQSLVPFGHGWQAPVAQLPPDGHTPVQEPQ